MIPCWPLEFSVANTDRIQAVSVACERVSYIHLNGNILFQVMNSTVRRICLETWSRSKGTLYKSRKALMT